MDNTQKQKHPIFQKEYEILSSLGEGNTSKVYLVRSIKNPEKMYALKLLREEFLQRDKESIKSVEQEIQILQGLNHHNIVNIVGYGSDGFVKKPSGREIKNLVYILLEYVTGGLLFDLCQTVGGMGEDAGRYFMTQMLDVLTYMQGKGVVHRDLKLENVLVDDQLNLKVADFGFATYKKITKLQSYRGTMTYMAPEIKEGKIYDGKQIDIFSTAVILFIIVQGIFPFKEAKKDEYFYNLLLTGKIDHYWKKVGGQNLSNEFKDLILRCFSYDGNKRPTLEEIRNHPWMTKQFSVKMTRQDILEKRQQKRQESTVSTEATREQKVSRSGSTLQLVRQTSLINLQNFNDMTDFDIACDPLEIWDELNNQNMNIFDSRLTFEKNVDKKYIRMSMKNDAEYGNLDVKLKFFQLERQDDEEDEDSDEENECMYRLKFVKKRGDIAKWYELLGEIKETWLENMLSTPSLNKKHFEKSHENLATAEESPDDE